MSFKNSPIKEKLYDIVFGTDTPAGKAFDIILVVTILGNSILIITESVDTIRDSFGLLIPVLAWIFGITFTIEYLLRLFIVKSRIRYALSFFGVVDLLAVLPLYISIFLPQVRFLAVVRIFRLLRLFSILKMGRYIEESSQLIRALRASKPKITVFLLTILFIVVIVGSMMYVIEGPENGFNNIPESMYWAIVTVSTVGFGDITPQTPLGKLLSSTLMIISYGIIAVPTGIISFELSQTSKGKGITKTCLNCTSEYYSEDDHFCSKCGHTLISN